mmetsp:Transcript_100341/g.312124  ORF Transcript_100341/g.312124 Transcript_100341/m.312124 type:complete len:302 (-) Transcript_100341:393-1298(-)
MPSCTPQPSGGSGPSNCVASPGPSPVPSTLAARPAACARMPCWPCSCCFPPNPRRPEQIPGCPRALPRPAVDRGLRCSLPPMARSISTDCETSGPATPRDVAWWIASCSASGSRRIAASCMATFAAACSSSPMRTAVGGGEVPGGGWPGKKASTSTTTGATEEPMLSRDIGASGCCGSGGGKATPESSVGAACHSSSCVAGSRGSQAAARPSALAQGAGAPSCGCVGSCRNCACETSQHGRMRSRLTDSLQSRSKVPGTRPRRKTRAEIQRFAEALWYSSTSPSRIQWTSSGRTRSLLSRS